jgi:hypothetical protein
MTERGNGMMSMYHRRVKQSDRYCIAVETIKANSHTNSWKTVDTASCKAQERLFDVFVKTAFSAAVLNMQHLMLSEHLTFDKRRGGAQST